MGFSALAIDVPPEILDAVGRVPLEFPAPV